MQLGLPFAALDPGHRPPNPTPDRTPPLRSAEPPGLAAKPKSKRPGLPRSFTPHLAPVADRPALDATVTEPETPSPEPVLHLVRHPRARRYVIRVRSDGSVRVTIPRGGSNGEARRFAERQRQWIDKHRQLVAQEQARARATVAPAVEREWRERASRELPVRLLELAQVHGLHVRRVSVRNQRWRWGSCSADGHICLNWRLMQVPPPIRDYVMIHELMHLKQMNHSPKFWKLVAESCPDYQAARQWLRADARRTRP